MKTIVAIKPITTLLFFLTVLSVAAGNAGTPPLKMQFLQYCADRGSKGGRDGVFNQVARLELGLEVQEHVVRETIAFVYTTRDCNDFAVGGLLRLLYLNKKKDRLSPALVQDVETCLRDFKYWWDDPRKDTVYRCYHTENHQAICHSDELLAGQLFKDKSFKSGMNGHQHMQHALERLERWLDFRVRFGFSEWLSNSYYDVDLMVLANLYDFAEDKAVRERAGLLIDVLMYDMALNNFQGVFGSTHGRTYANAIKGGREEATSTIMKLMFGVGFFNSSTSLGAVSLATSAYRCPEIIRQIATDYSETIRSRQRQSIDVEDAPAYGISYENELDCHLFWGMQEFIHPRVVHTSQMISQKYDTWPYRNYDAYIRKYQEQTKQHGKVITPHLDRFALSQANIETYRTPDYMLSSVQDYRKGAPGYQQHIWQATLGADAVVFTNHPGSKTEGVTPNYWAGNAIMPRAAQHKNVVVCIYNVPATEKMDFTHAYFPGAAFDEVIKEGAWIFARKNNGYLALYSQHDSQWQWDTHGQLYDLVAPARQNIWICEMGSKTQWGSFANFVKTVHAADVQCNALDVVYKSPSLGEVAFGWETPFSINKQEVSIDDYPRFENQFGRNDFSAKRVEIKHKNHVLILDFEKGVRMIK